MVGWIDDMTGMLHSRHKPRVGCGLSGRRAGEDVGPGDVADGLFQSDCALEFVDDPSAVGEAGHHDDDEFVARREEWFLICEPCSIVRRVVDLGDRCAVDDWGVNGEARADEGCGGAACVFPGSFGAAGVGAEGGAEVDHREINHAPAA